MKPSHLPSKILLLFFAIILAVPVFWVVRGKVEPQRSLIEYRTLNVFPSLSFKDFKTATKRVLQFKFQEAGELFYDQFTQNKFQTRFERGVKDQFPFRSPGIQLSKNLDRILIRMVYLFLDDPAIPADMRLFVYETRDAKILFPSPEKFTTGTINDIDTKISQYKTLMETYPDIHFYALMLELVENSQFNPVNSIFPGADAGRSIEYFMEHKPDGLNLAYLPMGSFADYTRLYFRTDHHWNINGTLAGYELTYDLLKEYYPDISPMIPHDNLYTFPDIGFLGRWARQVFYQTKPDPFTVALLDLPPYKIYNMAGEEIEYNKKAEYLAGKYSTVPFTDHYIVFNGADVDYLEYVSENGSQRNLLIIGGSYTNAIEPILAAHYHHTYAVDIRHYPDYYFSLGEFMMEHPVDDVLIIGGPSVVMRQWQWVINP